LWRLSRTGVTGDLPARDAQYIVFLNVVVLLVLFIGGQNIVLASFYLPRTAVSLIVMILQLICIAFSLLWNHCHNYLLARVWMSAVAATFLTLHTVILGTQPRFHFFLVICVFLMFYLFPPKQKFWMYLLIGILSGCFVGTEVFFHDHGLVGGISEQFVQQEYYFNTLGVLFCALSMGGVGYVTVRTAEDNALREHERSESLLRNILPASIAERLKADSGRIADSYPEATIMFVDIVGFTQIAGSMTPDALVDLLNVVFSEIDDLTEKYQLEKIKTIGDSYMVVAGAPEPRPDHAEVIATMSIEIMDRLGKLKRPDRPALDFRIGFHSGPVVAGVIGKKKFSYDLWGDSVNTAARLEAHGVAGEIHVSAHVRELLKDKFRFVERGLVTCLSYSQPSSSW
jgi:class 3 adenylate cyclase